jgi:predicted dehydrogenase
MHLHEQRSGPSAATETPAADVRLTAEARPLGYAVIGASSFAEFCMDSYAAHDRLSQRLKPLGVYSGSPQRAKDVAQRRGLRAYETIEDLLSEPTIDVVHIAGIPASHAQPAVAALQAGKHVLCEKPLAIDLPQAQLMTQAAAEAERRLGVNFMMRHGPLAESLGRLLDRGVLGAPLRCVSTNQAGDRGLPPDHWFWDESKSGGIFIEHGVHFFDLLRAWFGHAAVTHAWQQPRPGLPIVDQVGCSLAFEAGARVECYHGFLNAPPMDQQEHRMLLERGRLSLFGWVPRRIEVEAVLSFAQTEQLRAALPQGAEVRTLRELPAGEAYNSRRLHEEPADAHVFASWESAQDDQAVYAQALAALMSDFTQAVDEPTYRPRVTAQDGVEALRLAADARRLAQQRSIEQPSVRREPRRETTP